MNFDSGLVTRARHGPKSLKDGGSPIRLIEIIVECVYKNLHDLPGAERSSTGSSAECGQPQTKDIVNGGRGVECGGLYMIKGEK